MRTFEGIEHPARVIKRFLRSLYGWMSGLGSVLSMSFFRINRYLKLYTVNLSLIL